MKKIMLLMIAAMFSMVVVAQDQKTTELKISQLPKETTKWIANNIPGGNITRAGKIEDKGVISYAAVVETKGQKHAYLFDKDGKFTGKGDHMFKTTPATTPPVKTPATKPATKPTATEVAAPKK
jgi:hypothetical protein